MKLKNVDRVRFPRFLRFKRGNRGNRRKRTFKTWRTYAIHVFCDNENTPTTNVCEHTKRTICTCPTIYNVHMWGFYYYKIVLLPPPTFLSQTCLSHG